ncbi:hypothetical protein EEL30_10420 [Brevibacillus laterosporus]|uniref:Sucrose phosphatase-like domain-containing protein n=1 Tax=Brevibacillus laterosporus TaxID=1465 RepID=A0A518V6R7_BRELA|nr:hypothetical protein EEL30_10420 [Brevibacillus laterosporus]
MLYASDLDQTLIYSRRSFGAFDENSEKIRLVEMRGEKEISFMVQRATDVLKEIAAQMMFVPVTTRTREQYRRIHLFYKEIRPTYAVTSNGGHILYNGQLDMAWNHSVTQKIEDSSLPLHELIKAFAEIKSSEWLHNEYIADKLFYYCTVNRTTMPMEEILVFGDWANQKGWNLSIQGRKVYIVPHAVNKRDAVRAIQEREGLTTLISSGDSLLDFPLLDASDISIAPPHGELFQLRDRGNIQFTQKSGILASLEIVEMVMQVLQEGRERTKMNL